MRFELTRVEPNRFRIYRLNHSAMLPPHDCKQASKQQQQKQKIIRCPYNHCNSSGGQVGIEPTTSRTQIENHTTRPLTQSTYAFLAERSKALRSGRSIFGCVGSNPTGCIDTHCYNHHQSTAGKNIFFASLSVCVCLDGIRTRASEKIRALT